jgi:hypothetical protein
MFVPGEVISASGPHCGLPGVSLEASRRPALALIAG